MLGGFTNIFSSANFWSNYRCQSSASIEDLLNSKNCTVDKLLDDDDCLQEFKNLNKKLISFFDHDKLKVLIDYITIMPTPEDGHDRGHKYPFLAGEILNCEINEMLDKFFVAPERPMKEPTSEDEKPEAEKEKEETPEKDSKAAVDLEKVDEKKDEEKPEESKEQ